MNRDWIQRLPFFIDPNLRSSDKDLFKQITQDLEERQIEWVEELSRFERDSVLPSTFLLSSDTDLDPEIGDGDKTLIFGGSNMSIFGKKSFGGENHSINAFDDWKRFISSSQKVYGDNFRSAAQALLDESLAYFKSLLKGKDLLNLGEFEKGVSEIEEKLLGALTLEEVQEQLPKLSQEILGRSFSLLSEARAYGVDQKTLPLKRGGEFFYLSWDWQAQESLPLRIYSLMEDILGRSIGESGGVGFLEDMQHILSELTLPIALFNPNLELVLHNASFLRLNLSAKNCLNLENDQQFNHEEELYRARRHSLKQSGYELFSFFPVREFLGGSSSPSSEELGIISSSIAHELNNPLAGVSGALDVVLLDDHPEELELRLREMKAGVSRCKKLVETFLGFSKLGAKNQRGEALYDIESCLNSAMELIRFRLIENNVSLETRFERRKEFSAEFNPHVMSMTIYLMLGDLLTSFGHQKLVAGDRSASFNLRFHEDKRSLTLSSAENLGLGKEFLNSKLLTHLLEIHHLGIDSSPEAIRLYCL